MAWTTKAGELITLPVHCTAPNAELKTMPHVIEGIVLQPAGHAGHRVVVKAYLDCSPGEVRQNQKLLWSPSLVTCEANNSIYGVDERDVVPHPTSHTAYVVNPQVERDESGTLHSYVNVLLLMMMMITIYLKRS